MATAALTATVEKYLQNHRSTDERISVVNLHRSSDGWSDETYLIELQVQQSGGTQMDRIVIRKESSGLTLERMNLRHHYETLRALSDDTALPVPRPLWFESDATVLGTPFFVMELLPGRNIVPWSREGRQFFGDALRRANLAQEFVAYLAEIHGVNVRTTSIGATLGIPENYRAYLSQKLLLMERDYLGVKDGTEDPVIDDALCWLQENQPDTGLLTLVHGDYRSGNLLYAGDHIVGILDWELAEIGDPYVDIGYVFAKANRMDSSLLSYLIPSEQFIEAYQSLMGIQMDMARVQYFEVWHHVKFYIIAAMGKIAFKRGVTRDLRLYRQGERLPLMRDLIAGSIGY